MKTPTLVVSVAALVGAVSAGVVTLWLTPETPRGEARPAEEAVALPTADEGELRSALARLELENRGLVARIEALERRPVAPARVELEPVSVSSLAEHPAAIGDETRSMLLATDLPETVRAALEDIRAEEEAEEQRLREEREAARREERLERWREQFGLSSAQVGQMRTWVIDQDTARDELERQRDASGDRDAYRAARTELRADTLLALRGILTPAQFQAWEEREQRDEERGERRRD